MRANSIFVRGFIRCLSWDSKDAGASFADTLQSTTRALLANVSKGKVLIGTSTGGTSVTYALRELSTLTSDDLMEVCSSLLDSVDAIKAATPAITDDALVAALLAEFPSITSMRPDFSGCR